MENWIQINAAEDVAGSIRHVIRTSQFVGEDSHAWKWVVMALHSALQGACVCHLTTTAAPIGAVTERNTSEWIAYFNDFRTNPEVTPPKTFLMCLPDLLKAVRKPDSAGDRSNATGITISESELNWLTRFHKEFRNQFTHFELMAWSIEVSGVPDIAKLVARIIGDILQAGWAFRRLDRGQCEEMQRNLHALKAIRWPS